MDFFYNIFNKIFKRKKALPPVQKLNEMKIDDNNEFLETIKVDVRELENKQNIIKKTDLEEMERLIEKIDDVKKRNKEDKEELKDIISSNYKKISKKIKQGIIKWKELENEQTMQTKK